MTVIVQTPRLVVRKFKKGEGHLLVDLYGDERVTKHVPKRTVEETKRQFTDALKSYKLFPGLGRWGVFNVIDNDFIGVCILKPADSDPSRIELGYVLTPKYWGAGLATELARALVTYGFEEKGLQEICACTSPQNLASQNVLLKAGLQRDGNIFWHNANLSFFRIEKN